jgi:hypothetical protein
MTSLAITTTAGPTSSRRSSVNNQEQKRRKSSSKDPEILRLDDAILVEKEREINVATALRLIREVSKARSKSNLEMKKKRLVLIRLTLSHNHGWNRSAYSNIADEPQLILHNVESMKKDAQAAYYYKLRNTKVLLLSLNHHGLNSFSGASFSSSTSSSGQWFGPFNKTKTSSSNFSKYDFRDCPIRGA